MVSGFCTRANTLRRIEMDVRLVGERVAEHPYASAVYDEVAAPEVANAIGSAFAAKSGIPGISVTG